MSHQLRDLAAVLWCELRCFILLTSTYCFTFPFSRYTLYTYRTCKLNIVINPPLSRRCGSKHRDQPKFVMLLIHVCVVYTLISIFWEECHVCICSEDRTNFSYAYVGTFHLLRMLKQVNVLRVCIYYKSAKTLQLILMLYGRAQHFEPKLYTKSSYSLSASNGHSNTILSILKYKCKWALLYNTKQIQKWS